MMQYFFSENLKIKHTFIKKLMWLAPILVILFSACINTFYFQSGVYNWWYALMLPGILSLDCVLLSRIDGSMKNRAIIGLPINLKKIWVTKVLIGVKNIAFSCMLIFVAAQLGAFVLPIDSASKIAELNGLFGIIIIIITYAWQVPLCMFLGSKIGMFPTIILSVVVNFISGAMAIEKYWWVTPFSYPERLMCPILKILPNGLQAQPGNQTFTLEVLNTSAIPLGIGVSIILFLTVTYLTAKWYERQEVA